MNISIHLGRLLAILLIAGLVFAPFSAPANAAKNTAATAPMATSEMSTSEMSADMPCCPDKSAPMDCDQCPLMAICMVQNFQTPSPAGVIEVQPVMLRMLAPRSDPQAEGLNYLPLPRPPRSLVRSA